MVKRINKFAGFTLIEVMVALAIIAIALSAVSRSLGVTVSNQSHLESRVVATWVAENVIAQQQISAGSNDESTQTVEMLNRKWLVTSQTESTFLPEIYRLSVEVKEQGSEEVSANLFSVVGTNDK
ncbi:type II secretion system minor pseudopilin GspI [Thiomicrorhabdus sp.]|uniref:type II secretion system minor pseudopilin GspI n=1 Tax=Thiomicrorhabdus sp. TaxID=2039724 RepID=UPI002AA76B26|nr:type II secretion system minor pseudopilin GspI [Thiomicrorhabdus sp.]